MTTDIFEILLLIARPGAGKSEIIQYLNNLNPTERLEKYHIGEMDVLDDFPMLWAWFEEDKILTRLGHPRLHTDDGTYFIGNYMWDVLIERICLEYEKLTRDTENYHTHRTAILEFSRGVEHGGYKRAFQHLNPDMVKKMAILSVNVSWEESLRKNRIRFNHNKPDSIIEHALPDIKLERLYRETDWDKLTKSNPEFVRIQNIDVPYVVFENEDDVTSEPGDDLAERLEAALSQLWDLFNGKESR